MTIRDGNRRTVDVGPYKGEPLGSVGRGGSLHFDTKPISGVTGLNALNLSPEDRDDRKRSWNASGRRPAA